MSIFSRSGARGLERLILVMESIEENRYRYFGKSIDSINNSIDTRIFFRKSPSWNSHPQISHLFRLSDFEFFGFLQHSPHFPVISILDFNFFLGGGEGAFLVTIPETIPSFFFLVFVTVLQIVKFYQVFF